MFGKTYMKFDIKNGKEYIYSRESFDNNEPYYNDIGKTFIDFLANSDDIIKIIEDEVDSFHKNDKLSDTTQLHTSTNFKLEKLNIFFKYFDFDSYLENYIKNLRDKNNIKIKDFLLVIKRYEKNIKYYNSQKYYDELLNEQLSFYHDYNSKESKKAFYYIKKAENSVNKEFNKFIDKYGYKPSHRSWQKLYNKNKNAKKGDEMIDEIEKRIYAEHKFEIYEDINKSIKHNIKKSKDIIDSYKRLVKNYVKDNERTLEEVFDEYIIIIKFWINFSKYLLINYYNLSSQKHNNNFSANQRLLDFLLHIETTYYNKNIFELPKSNITLELSNDNKNFDLNDFIRKHIKDLLHNDENIYKKLNTYTVDIIQEYSINSIEDFLTVSLTQILQNKVKICKCENCDKLFVSVNKANEKYCTYNFKDKKTCRDLSYSIHLQRDELSNILRKKYRAENARKNRNQHIPKIEEKFQDWYSKAKKQKALCEKGKISIDQYNKWFQDNKKWF